MDARIELVLREQRCIAVADHPRWRSTLSRLKAAGELVAPLPGVYLASRFEYLDWLRAISAWAGPQGVLHGTTAASLWAPQYAATTACLAHPTLRSRPLVAVTRQVTPSDFVRYQEGIRFVSPAHAVVELAARDDGRAICEALRLRLVHASALSDALQAQRGSPGNRVRSRVVAGAMGNPWSYAELRLQRILIAAGISDWVANSKLMLGGRETRPDLRFRRQRLIIEFDGREIHSDPARFLADRERINLFETFGYHVLRFGWEHLDQPEYIVRAVRSALRRTALT